jgi:hypothetical protein
MHLAEAGHGEESRIDVIAIGAIRGLKRNGRGRGGGEIAKLNERATELTRGARLDEQITERGRLLGAGDHGQLRQVGGHLAEQLVARAAADDVDHVEAMADDELEAL